ncbi:hypothetical protein BaRGS_00029838 [Batillaria attramentaria]|uniref:Uncharacterized protein n=1 Tax=Batillaria attramentaria TaxID=370345 RepID=A0ABD0JV51_9CAEN
MGGDAEHVPQKQEIGELSLGLAVKAIAKTHGRVVIGTPYFGGVITGGFQKSGAWCLDCDYERHSGNLDISEI